MSGFCPFAKLVDERRTTDIVMRTPWGVALHTTGRGVAAKAKRTGRTVDEVAIEIYLASQNGSNGYPWGGPGYLIVYDGTIYQLAEDTTRTNHIGSSEKKRQIYLSGAWQKKVSRVALARWHAEWGPRYQSPQQLFPSRAPNQDLVGVEIVPIGAGLGGEPMRPGLLFTKAEHDAAVKLAIDIARRNNFPDGWYWKDGDEEGPAARLVSHEDVGLLDRHDCCLGVKPDKCKGGYDIGWLRERPLFDMAYVRSEIALQATVNAL